jgi:hypothetical protein
MGFLLSKVSYILHGLTVGKAICKKVSQTTFLIDTFNRSVIHELLIKALSTKLNGVSGREGGG